MSRLEDLAFKHLYPAEYRDIADLLAEKLTEREAYVDEMVATIEEELKRYGIEASGSWPHKAHLQHLPKDPPEGNAL